MTTETTLTALPTDEEACPTCRGPMAGSQRYCLHCGTRRPQARLDFLDVLEEDGRARPGTATLAPVALPPDGGRGAGWAAAVAPQVQLGLLLLGTLLVGLLIGRWASDDAGSDAPSAAAPAPQVIRVEGGAAPAAAAADSEAGTSSSPSSSSKASSKSSGKDDASSTKATAPKGAADVGKLSSKEIEKAAKKGQPITTGGGKLPPKDSKPAAGGTDFTEIG